MDRAYPEQRVIRCLPDMAGDPYRPSNGTEGMMFQGVFCDECARECVAGNYCRILARALGFGIGDPEYPKEWIYGDDGWPMCSAYKRRGGGGRKSYRCPDSPDMFGPRPVKIGAVEAIVDRAMDVVIEPEKQKATTN